MKEEVQRLLSRAFHDWLRDQPGGLRAEEFTVSVETAPADVPGDTATNLPLTVAKRVRRPPRDVAREILGCLAPGGPPSGDRASLAPGGPVDKAEVAGPGFLNFTMSNAWLVEELRTILLKREAYARRVPAGAGSVLIEFVSANPNGPLHVGHGRGAALGDSLARIFRHLGHEVTTEYYVNDYGNQMENLGASLIGRCRELDPASVFDDEVAAAAARRPEDLYRGDYLKDVARGLLAKFPDKNARPRGLDFFRKVGVAYMLQEIQRDLNAFRVTMDSWYAESRLHEQGLVEKTLASLREKGYLKEEGGALWFLSTAFGDDKDRVIRRRDERPTYFASDIAYHHHKFERGFRKLVDIWGTDHHGYVRRVKAAVAATGHDPEDLAILLYQLVGLVRDGKPVAMSTRTGEFVTLREVMEEVGADACRFFFAMRGPDSQLEFDLDLAKKRAPENPVFYVQYVHARCGSLFREAAKRGVAPAAPGTFPAPGHLDPAERALLLRLASFPDVVELCRRDFSPHHLTAFLLGLAGDYHRFYENCRVLGEARETEAFRLALADGVRTLIRGGLDLLGVSAPETM